jgi:hypothetical protein
MTDRALDYEFPSPWPYEAVVTSRDDPYGLGRVKAVIDGEADETEWLWPAGNPGAGARVYGGLITPPLGADIVVTFINAQRENGRFVCGNFGKGELPPGTHIASDAEWRAGEGDNVVWQNRRTKIEVDDRSASTGIRISDLATGLGINLDLNSTTRTVTVTGQLGLILRSSGLIDIRGSTLLLNGRPVSPVGPPI